MTLYEQLRDAPANCMIPLQHGVGTPTVALTEPARAAVLNLIEAARAAAPYVSDSPRPGAEPCEQRLYAAVAVFVTPEGDRSTMSGQEDERRSP